MFTNRPFVRVLTLALVGAATVLPATAMADSTPTKVEQKKEHKAPQFPMDAKDFRVLMDKHIEHARKRLNKELDAHNVPAATQTEIRKRFEDAIKQIRAAADKVSADGTVTKDEAKEVHHLAKELKRKAMADFRGQARTRKTPS